jgi:hypothetical protein
VPDPRMQAERLMRRSAVHRVAPPALALCLLVAVLMTVTDVPAPLRAPFAVFGLLGAPGAVWLELLGGGLREAPLPARAALAATASCAVLVLIGVAMNTVGIPLSGSSLAAGALMVTVAGLVPWTRRALSARGAAQTPDPRGNLADGGDAATTNVEVDALDAIGRNARHVASRRVRRAAPALAILLAVCCFGAAVWVTASWMHLVSTGPYIEIWYGGGYQNVAGPLEAAPGATLDVPVHLAASSPRPWRGVATVTIDATVVSSQPVAMRDRTLFTVRIRAPRARGSHHLRIAVIGAERWSDVSLTATLKVGRHRQA